jgi:hypothetical protein
MTTLPVDFKLTLQVGQQRSAVDVKCWHSIADHDGLGRFSLEQLGEFCMLQQ